MNSSREPSSMPTRVETWMEIVSGQRRGVVASTCRAGLSLVASMYRVITGARNLVFDYGWRSSVRVDAPVISVGNLTAGGTGKTPTVACVVRMLQALGQRPAIISRGYGGHGGVNDEKLVLDQLVPGVPHLLNPRRAAAARDLMNRSVTDRPQVIVLDDAFQHRQMTRDFDLVLIDCLNPWGYGHLLPRGLLREPLHSLKRASCVLLTRCDQVTADVRSSIEAIVRRWTSAPILSSRFQPTRLLNCRGETRPLESLRGQQVAAFCGIGNPAGFRRTLNGLGVAIPDEQFRVFPDHHAYSPRDLNEIGHWAGAVHANCLVSTQKDLVKIPHESIGDISLWAVEIALQFEDPAGESQLKDLLSAVVG